MEEAAERLRQFLLTSANSLGIKDDWIIPCADLLEKVAKERDGLHKYIKFKCVATSDSPRYNYICKSQRYNKCFLIISF